MHIKVRKLVRKYKAYINYIIQKPIFILRDVSMDATSEISRSAIVNYSRIGKYSYIGKYSIIESAAIGNYCSIGNHVQLGGYEHAYWYYSSSHHFEKKGLGGVVTTLGHDVWVGSGAFIKQGVNIGHGAVIAAGAVVIKDVPPFTIVGGIPAKVIKFRFNACDIETILKSNYWLFSKEKATKVLESLHSLKNEQSSMEVKSKL